MNRLPICALFAFSTLGIAQSPTIHSGATVYVVPMDGYETYLAGAILRKNVPVVVVTDRDKADYILQGKVTHANLNSPAPTVVVNNTVNNAPQTQSLGNQMSQAMQQGYDEGAARRRAMGMTFLSVSIISAQSSQVIFAASSEKDGRRQLEKTADDCAKYLKEFIEKSEKLKK